MNSALAGYLMLSAKEMTNSLAALPPEALAELGALQASIQAGIEARSLPGERSVNGLIRPFGRRTKRRRDGRYSTLTNALD